MKLKEKEEKIKQLCNNKKIDFEKNLFQKEQLEKSCHELNETILSLNKQIKREKLEKDEILTKNKNLKLDQIRLESSLTDIEKKIKEKEEKIVNLNNQILSLKNEMEKSFSSLTDYEKTNSILLQGR